jgi:hypothetical protein
MTARTQETDGSCFCSVAYRIASGDDNRRAVLAALKHSNGVKLLRHFEQGRPVPIDGRNDVSPAIHPPAVRRVIQLPVVEFNYRWPDRFNSTDFDYLWTSSGHQYRHLITND